MLKPSYLRNPNMSEGNLGSFHDLAEKLKIPQIND